MRCYNSTDFGNNNHNCYYEQNPSHDEERFPYKDENNNWYPLPVDDNQPSEEDLQKFDSAIENHQLAKIEKILADYGISEDSYTDDNVRAIGTSMLAISSRNIRLFIIETKLNDFSDVSLAEYIIGDMCLAIDEPKFQKVGLSCLAEIDYSAKITIENLDVQQLNELCSTARKINIAHEMGPAYNTTEFFKLSEHARNYLSSSFGKYPELDEVAEFVAAIAMGSKIQDKTQLNNIAFSKHYPQTAILFAVAELQKYKNKN